MFLHCPFYYSNSYLSILILFFFITKSPLFKTLLFPFIALYFSLDILILFFHYYSACKVNWLSKKSIKNLTMDLNLDKIHIKFFLYLQYFFFKRILQQHTTIIAVINTVTWYLNLESIRLWKFQLATSTEEVNKRAKCTLCIISQ